jgi:hypothetical protein
MGTIPLLWKLKNSFSENLGRLTLAALTLFVFNLVRLAAEQVLHVLSFSWTLVDGVLGGFAYFVVWLTIWRSGVGELLFRSPIACGPERRFATSPPDC